MVFINSKNLTIINTDKIKTTASIEEISEALLNKPNSTIYFISNNKLYGLISSGDISRACYNEIYPKAIPINTSFTKIFENNYFDALQILFERSKINSIPIVNQKGNLIGEYSRVDEILPIKTGYSLENKSIEQITNLYRKIALILPDKSIENKHKLALKIQDIIRKKDVTVDILYGNEFLEKYSSYDCLITLDRNDSWAIGAISNTQNIDKIDNFFQKRKTLIETTEIATIVEDTLRVFEDNGIDVLNLYFEEESEYAKALFNIVRSKYTNVSQDLPADSRVLPEFAKDFFEELYSEYYLAHVGSEDDIELHSVNGIKIPKDLTTEYRNYKNGIRKTFFQPKNYNKTIYFFGPCFIRGALTEDKHTIPSFVQNMLNEDGYNIKVINVGDYFLDNLPRLRYMRNVFNNMLQKGDIVITYFTNRIIEGVRNLDLMDALKESSPHPEWFTDMHTHCNYKVNKIYAKSIYSNLKKYFNLSEVSNEKPEYKFEDFYLIRRYFENIDTKKFKQVGSIVMNCNPFTNGHRYLIEQAKSQCDLLIIFVVFEDKSVFSFHSRYTMVKMGTEDMTNVIVAPSGYNILTSNNFPEYFIKTVDEDISRNAENDIKIFAKDIAPFLNITKRFVGEELTDEVTRHYNDAMKKILPKYGIELIEIPRKKLDGNAISATTVREHLKNNDIESLAKLVPKSTIDVMFYELK